MLLFGLRNFMIVFFSVGIRLFSRVRRHSAHGGGNGGFGPVSRGDYRRRGPSWAELSFGHFFFVCRRKRKEG